MLQSFILENETGLRLGSFLAILGLMLVWEAWRPRRRPLAHNWRRRGTNLALVVCNSLLLRLLMPMVAVGVAAVAQQQGWGLLHWLVLPQPVAIGLAIVLLDLAIYAQHVVFHHVPVLWRLHRVHHTDLALDATSGLRFHPLEILLSLWFKMLLVLLLGAPVVAVVAFEIVLNAMAVFNHGNVYIPPALDRCLRVLLVTPDMHRVHHSVIKAETNSNYGFNLSCWDRLFHSYRQQPRDGQLGMTIGLEEYRDPRGLGLLGLLWQPFVRAGGYDMHDLLPGKKE